MSRLFLSTVTRWVAVSLLAAIAVGVIYSYSSNELNRYRIYDSVKRGDLAEMNALLRDDASLASSKDSTGGTPLHQAPNKNVAELLVAHGGDVNARDNRRCTPLHMAVPSTGGKRKDVVEFLLANGADVNAKNDLGMTPLHLAMIATRLDVVELLLAHGADANAEDAKGMTPLHWAAMEGRKDVVELLLAHGADPNGKYGYGWTPARLAADNNHPDIVTLLHQHGGWD